MCGCVEAYGGGSDSHRPRGLLGCGLRLTLPTGIVDVPGVVGVGVISQWVYLWLVVFYCVVLLVGSHVMPMVDHRGLGL